MAKVEVKLTKFFTTIPNEIIRNKELSLKSKGLLVTMLSLPNDWNYTIEGLNTILKEGKDSIRSSIVELEKHGYITRERERLENGRLGDMKYTVYQFPISKKTTVEKPTSENPTQVNPTQEKATQLNTYIQNTDVLNTDKINTDLQNIEKGDTTNKFVGEVDTSVSEQKPTAKSNKRTYSELKELETDMLKRVVKICDTNLGFSQSKTKEVLELFEYYLYKYTQKTGKIHPILTDSTLERIINELLAERNDDENHKYFGGILEYEGVAEAMIDTFFEKGLGDGTDYHLSHFATNGVLLNLGCRANLGEI